MDGNLEVKSENIFRNFLQKYTYLSDEDWRTISSFFTREEIPKNTLLLEEGKICRYFWFLELGLIRFFINKDGDDITKFFTVAPFCFTSALSFRTQQPANESIETIEDCVVWRINLSQADELLTLPNWLAFTRKFTQEVQFYTEELLFSTKTETAETRYIKLLEKHPDLLSRIPLKHLSSFLGIAPQSLSRIRKKFSSSSSDLT